MDLRIRQAYAPVIGLDPRRVRLRRQGEVPVADFVTAAKRGATAKPLAAPSDEAL